MKIILLLLSLVTSQVYAIDRCEQYVQPVRKAHSLYFGLDYPSQYGVGQLKQESGCRDVISNDSYGSSTPAQITYKFWNKQLTEAGLASSHWTTQQAYIMKDAHNKNPYKKLWVTYQIYNGGNWVVKEVKKADVVDWEAALAQCTRGYTTFKNGSKISNCEINYDYSIKIYEYGNKYGDWLSKEYRYW